MRFIGWLNELRNAHFPPGRRESAPSKTKHTRLRLEHLESRLTPAVLTVTNANDLGFGSLRFEIGLANSGDTIAFSSVMNGQTIKLASPLAIAKNLTINGQTADGLTLLNITVSGQKATELFNVTAGTSTLFHLNLNDGLATGATGSSGGAILVANGATLNAATDIFTSDKATNAGGNGGAIENLGTLTVTASEFLSCGAAQNGGAIDSAATGTQTLTVSGTTFDGNSANNGGAIYTTNNTTLNGDTFNDGIISSNDNSATVNGGAVAAVGATPGTTQLTVKNSTFLCNVAGSDGGAIYSTDGLTNITTSTFTSNQANEGGAVTFFIDNAANPATSYDATLIVDLNTFTTNKATTGGAVLSNVTTNAGKVTTSFTNSTFYENQATDGDGGGLSVNHGTSANGAATASLFNDTFFMNTATGHGGGLALALPNTGTLANTAALTSLTVYKNTAGTDGGGLYGNSAKTNSITINNSILDQNTVTAQGYTGPIDVTFSNNAAFEDLDYNLVGTSNALLFVTLHDIKNDNAGLSNALAANGAPAGYPQTLAPLVASPAYRAGDPLLPGKPNPYSIDERGMTRQVGKVTIGAEDPDAIAPVVGGG